MKDVRDDTTVMIRVSDLLYYQLGSEIDIECLSLEMDQVLLYCDRNCQVEDWLA